MLVVAAGRCSCFSVTVYEKVSIGKNESAGKIKFNWFHKKCFLFPYSNTFVREIRLRKKKLLKKNLLNRCLVWILRMWKMFWHKVLDYERVMTHTVLELPNACAIWDLQDLLTWTPQFEHEEIRQNNELLKVTVNSRQSRLMILILGILLWNVTMKCFVSLLGLA